MLCQMKFLDPLDYGYIESDLDSSSNVIGTVPEYHPGSPIVMIPVCVYRNFPDKAANCDVFDPKVQVQVHQYSNFLLLNMLSSKLQVQK